MMGKLSSAIINESTPANIADSVIQQSAKWHATLKSEEITASDLQAFQTWHDAHPIHATTYAKMTSLWSSFESVNSNSGKSTLQKYISARKSKLKIKKEIFMIGFCVMSLGGWMATQTTYPKYYFADYRSNVGQQLKIQLADSSDIILDTNSAINIHYSGSERRIALVQGSLFIKVAKDPNRPLIIETPSGTAQALGTQFFVEKHTESMVVGVTESKVRICTENNKRECQTLQAGEQSEIWETSLSMPQKMHNLNAIAWTKGNLVADNATLSDVLGALNRYKFGNISYDPMEINDIRVSGVFKLTDVDQSLNNLAETLPIRISHYSSYWTTVRAK